MILGRIRNAVRVSPLLVHLKQYVLEGDVRQWSLSGDESSRLQKKKKKQPLGIKN